jgi:hypothetical protein
VPVEVDVFLIGFEADGGYAHKVDSMMLQNLLNAGEEVTHCPRSLDTRGDLGLCFKVHYPVLGHAELGGEVRGGPVRGWSDDKGNSAAHSQPSNGSRDGGSGGCRCSKRGWTSQWLVFATQLSSARMQSRCSATQSLVWVSLQ